jgi:hypothetical protein
MAQKMKILTALAGLVVLNGFTGFAYAQSTAPSSAIEFPMIGMGFNQTFQLNVIVFPNGPCKITLAILDSAGATIASQTSEGGSGNTTYTALPVTNQVSAFPQRKQVHGVVTLTPTTTSPCRAQATVEVFDNFTRTDWVLLPQPPPEVPQGPPDRPLGPVGLIFEQTARLNVVAHPPQPCLGTIGFTDTSGRPISAPMPVNLAPNHATFLDLTGLQAGIALGSQRPEVLGVFTPSSTNPAPGVCIASLEVFDQLSGYTRVLIPQPPPD